MLSWQKTSNNRAPLLFSLPCFTPACHRQSHRSLLASTVCHGMLGEMVQMTLDRAHPKAFPGTTMKDLVCLWKFFKTIPIVLLVWIQESPHSRFWSLESLRATLHVRQAERNHGVWQSSEPRMMEKKVKRKEAMTPGHLGGGGTRSA